jgi:hypothetical protein
MYINCTLELQQYNNPIYYVIAVIHHKLQQINDINIDEYIDFDPSSMQIDLSSDFCLYSLPNNDVRSNILSSMDRTNHHQQYETMISQHDYWIYMYARTMKILFKNMNQQPDNCRSQYIDTYMIIHMNNILMKS